MPLLWGSCQNFGCWFTLAMISFLSWSQVACACTWAVQEAAMRAEVPGQIGFGAAASKKRERDMEKSRLVDSGIRSFLVVITWHASTSQPHLDLHHVPRQGLFPRRLLLLPRPCDDQIPK